MTVPVTPSIQFAGKSLQSARFHRASVSQLVKFPIIDGLKLPRILPLKLYFFLILLSLMKDRDSMIPYQLDCLFGEIALFHFVSCLSLFTANTFIELI